MADKITETTAIMTELLGAFDKISRSQLLFIRDMTTQHESLKSSHAQISTKIQNLLKNVTDTEVPKPEKKIVQIVPKESKKRFVRDSSE